MKILQAALIVCFNIRAAPLTPETAAAFEHFYNLEFDEALAIFIKHRQANPNSPFAHNYVAQAILYRAMLRAGALETELVTGGNAFLRRQKMEQSPADSRAFDEAISNALRLSDEMLARNAGDKEALYCRGVAYGLRANHAFLVRKAWLDALRDATDSRKSHNRITEFDPALTDARMTQGVHEYIVGSLPWQYRVLGVVAGFRGNKEQGIKTLQLVWKNGVNNRWDAAILLATVYRRERRAAEAVPLLDELIARFPRNYLFRLELAQMHADLGDKRKALASVAAVESMKLAGWPGYRNLPTEKIVFFRSTIQFWYMDLDSALAGFRQVTRMADELDPNTGATAWMRLGQTYDLKGERTRAIEAYQKCIAYAPGSYRARESEQYLRRPFRRT
jgi:tetratricopeptide (TPR) repeat protein